MARNYYEILGVSKNASKDDIRRAYRKLAHEHHPDKGGGDAAKFREVNEAYEVLSDETKRSQYDRFGSAFAQGYGGQAGTGFGGFSGFSDFSDFAKGFGGFDFGSFSAGGGSAFGGDLGDIFSDIFGAPRQKRASQGIDLEMNLEIEFLESVFGAEKEATIMRQDMCPTCRGSTAAPGSKVNTCPKCHGQGQINIHQKTILGNIQRSQVCDQCEGSGKVPEKACPDCKGAGVKRLSKTVKIAIPAGIADGQTIRLADEGEVGYRGSKRGNLFIAVRVKPHPEFRRQGYEIITEVPVSFYQAALGAKVEINTVDGPVDLKIPSGIQSGKMLRLKGRGVPHLEGRGRGDHIAIIRVLTPQKLTKKEKDILKQLEDENGETANVHPHTNWKDYFKFSK